MVVLVHPFGNANVRAALDAFDRSGLLERFVTTIGWSRRSFPYLSDHIHGKLRRNYAIAADKLDVHPMREVVRLVASAMPGTHLTRHETGWASVDQVWQSLDREVAKRLRRRRFGAGLRVVYAYEDCAQETFRVAGELGLKRTYDLPIAYWEMSQRLLREEAERYPDWAPTLPGVNDSAEKLERKSREIDLADLVIAPSRFVLESIPAEIRASKPCLAVPFGSPRVEHVPKVHPGEGTPLRVLFAGALTQRKGLADIFAAMKLVRSSNVQLVVMGSLLRPLEWYRAQFADFIYESPRPQRDVLSLMKTCDVFLLPSVVEGRALVQQEAMASGLPLLATVNAGADDLIVEYETGFLLPIRSPEQIAEKLDWCAANRSRLPGMGIAAQNRARELTWRSYGDELVAAVRGLMTR